MAIRSVEAWGECCICTRQCLPLPALVLLKDHHSHMQWSSAGGSLKHRMQTAQRESKLRIDPWRPAQSGGFEPCCALLAFSLQSTLCARISRVFNLLHTAALAWPRRWPSKIAPAIAGAFPEVPAPRSGSAATSLAGDICLRKAHNPHPASPSNAASCTPTACRGNFNKDRGRNSEDNYLALWEGLQGAARLWSGRGADRGCGCCQRGVIAAREWRLDIWGASSQTIREWSKFRASSRYGDHILRQWWC